MRLGLDGEIVVVGSIKLRGFEVFELPTTMISRSKLMVLVFENLTYFKIPIISSKTNTTKFVE